MRQLPRALVILAALALLLTACAGDAADDPIDVAEGGTTEETETAEATEETTEEATEEATDEATDEATGGGSEEPMDDATETAGGGAAGGGEVAVAETDLGEVLVDGEGMTLYMFDPDEGGEPTCYEDCAASWPPALAEGEPHAGEGVDAALLGTAERTDGTMQVTYNDWPLYRWAADEAPGDVGGQGVGGVWWVLAPDGSPQRDG